MVSDEIPRLDPSGKSIIDFVKYICDEVGPRIGGSEQEKQAGNIIQEKLDEYCDETTQEEFTCRPGGFLDFIWVTVFFYILGILAYFFISPLLSVVLLFLALAIYSLQQNFLLEVVDFLFPKKTSYHVVGKIKPKNAPPTKLILLAGHHDSAYEFPLFSKLGEKSFLVIIFCIAITLLNLLLGLLRTVFVLIDGSLIISDPFQFLREIQTNNFAYILDLVQVLLFFIGIITILGLAFNLRSNNVVLGANDNLSAVAAVLEIGKYLSINRPAKTEVWLISFAGEEHMRGSKRFVSEHKEELKNRQGMLLNLESLNAEAFLIATGETMFLAKHSPLVIEFASKAAEKVAGKIDFSYRVANLPFAGSDAANFSRKGLHATTMFGLATTGIPTDWHTLNDIPENLVGSRIAKAAEVALQFVYDIDQSD